MRLGVGAPLDNPFEGISIGKCFKLCIFASAELPAGQ